ncbi:hypothetical protein Tco_1212254 [Tanacetum coccineum]
MADLTFTDSHNMVAYLEKSEDNVDLAKIVDFLNASPIRYKLTVSPTVYVSYIEQFWSTAKIKTVNNETQICAKVDGKTIVITESSVRRDLHFNDKDVDGEGLGQPTKPQHTLTTALPYHVEPIPIVASLSQSKKTKKHRKTKRKATKISQYSGPTTLVADETVHEERGDSVERAATTATSLYAEQGSGNINRTQSTAIPNDPFSQGIDSGGSPRRQDTMGDRPDQTRFERLSKQSNKPPLSRANTLGSGEDSIKLQELMDLCTKLPDKVLDLENVKDAQALEIKKIESSAEKSLGDPEDASKQGRNEIDQDEGISWFQEDSETQGRYGHDVGVNTTSTSINTASINITTVEPVTTASAPVTTASVSVSTAKPSTPPTTITTTTTPIKDEDLTIAQTLIKMKSEKSKAKGVTMQEPSESGIRVRVPPPQIDPKNKGKAKMVEPEKPKKKKYQIEYDAGVAQRLQEELDEEARLEREREKEASKAANITEWDDVQAIMDANYELGTKLQAKEQGDISIEERSKLFMELMNKRKIHFARLRAEKQRRKPLTKAQKRNQMSNYLKNMAGYTLQQLRGYSFDEIKTLFETTMRKVNTFVPIESEVDKGVPELAAGSSKRAAEEEHDQESSKRQKTGESSELAKEPKDKEADELFTLKALGSNGRSSKLEIILREREIWVELKRLFEQDTDDELWKLLKHIHDLTWRLYDSCGVHHVSTEKGIYIYMLVEKEYPLSRGTLTLMLVAKLLVDQDNEMSRELLRKIFMQVERPRGGLLGIKSLHT